MTTEISIPADILQIIRNKQDKLRAEQDAKEQADKREQDELFARGSQIYMDARNKAIELLPEWIRQYVDAPAMEIEDYVHLGRGYNVQDWLKISIPGLSKILFDSKKQAYDEATAWWNGYEEHEPELRFDRDSGWRKDLEYTLYRAAIEFRRYQENLARWEAAREDALRRYNEREAAEQAAAERKQEREQERAEQEASDKREEIALFNALKDDPVAVHLLKAFVLLRFERSHFEDQLIEADETISSIEYRYTRRAEELRRQADEAERRAQNEKDRLQSDLDDAEAKLKKAEKAQRGW